MLKDAFALHQQGRFAEAEQLYAQVVKDQPQNVQARHLLGVLALQTGDPGRAAEHLQAALRLEPRQALAHRDLGNALQALGRMAEALASYDKALHFMPTMSEAHNGRGAMLAALGRGEEAMSAYTQAIALKPAEAAPYNNRGRLLAGQGHGEEAIEDFGRAIARKPDHLLALVNRGGAYLGQGRAADALADFDRALALDPNSPAVHDARGTALAMLGRPAEALAAHDAALALEPGFVIAQDNRGVALAALLRYDEALAAHDNTLELDPNSALAWNNRGSVLSRMGRKAEALESYDRALALVPDRAATHNNRGLALYDLGMLDEALESHETALRLAPGYVEASFAKSLALLMQGRFLEAWPLYENRNARKALDAHIFCQSPRWTGAEDLNGKVFLINAEQGLGDSIQFARYAALAKLRGARVILAVQNNLVRVLKGITADVEICSNKAPLPECDYQTILLSLPMAFDTTPQSIPAATSYLKADPALVRLWGEKIGKEGYRVGVAWQSGPMDPHRSWPLVALAEISRLPGVRLISLQKGVSDEKIAASGVTLETLGADFDSGPDAFVDTAALMENLDLVITPDTSVAHLAGALGRPVWVGLKFAPDWRWGMTGQSTPWYPGMRLFRQDKIGDWQPVFAAMLDRLKRKDI